MRSRKRKRKRVASRKREVEKGTERYRGDKHREARTRERWGGGRERSYVLRAEGEEEGERDDQEGEGGEEE